MNKQISIIGGTGMLGLPVVKTFLQHHYTVHALVRNPAKASAILSDGVQLS
jgi:uncharacterized protein YbjT (DUF2867 family)